MYLKKNCYRPNVEARFVDEARCEVHDVLVSRSGELLDALHRSSFAETSKDVLKLDTGLLSVSVDFMMTLLQFLRSQDQLEMLVDKKNANFVSRISSVYERMSNVIVTTISSVFATIASTNEEDQMTTLLTSQSFQTLLDLCQKVLVNALSCSKVVKKFISNASETQVWNEFADEVIKILKRVFLKEFERKNSAKRQRGTVDIEDDEWLMNNDFSEPRSSSNAFGSSVTNDFVDDAKSLKQESVDALMKMIARVCSMLRQSSPNEASLQNLSKIEEFTLKLMSEYLSCYKDNYDQCYETCFDAIDVLLEVPEPQANVESLHQIITLLQTVAKLTVSTSTFNADVVKRLIGSLKLAVFHFNGKSLEQDKRSILVFIKTFFKLQSMTGYERLSVELHLSLIDLLGSLTGFDWAVCTGSEYNIVSQDERERTLDPRDEVRISRSLFRFLNHNCYEIREAACVQIHKLFVDVKDVSKIRQDFGHLYKDLVYLNQVVAPTKPDYRDQEDLFNRYASTILVYSTIAMKCKQLEREAVVGMILATVEANVPQKVIKKVMNNLAGTGSSSAEYLRPILSYILEEFFNSDHKVQRFPLCLFDCSNVEEFVKRHEVVVVPMLLWTSKSGDDLDQVMRELSELLDKSKAEILRENFAAITAFYLPPVASCQRKSDIVPKKILMRAQAIESLMNRILGESLNYQLLNEFIPEVFANVLRAVHDPKAAIAGQELPTESLSAASFNLVKPSAPSTSELLALSMVEFFASTVIEDTTLFAYLSSEKMLPDCLQRMIHKLCEPIKGCANKSLASRSDKLKAAHGLKLFVSQLSKEVVCNESPTSLKKQLPYLAWYLTNTLMTAMTEDLETGSEDTLVFSTMTTKVLDTLFDMILGHEDLDFATKIIKKLCVPLANGLVKSIVITQANPLFKNLEGRWIGILNKIIIRFSNKANDAGLNETLRQLHPFPKIPSGIFQSFQDHINHREGNVPFETTLKLFLSRSWKTHSTESLTHLHQVLTSNRQTIKTLVDGLSLGRGFSEDAAESLLHRLIASLFDLFQCDEAVSRMALKCLGEIGPVNLSTLIFKPSSANQEDKVVVVVKSLVEYLVNDSVETSEAASQALKHVLATSESQIEFDQDLAHLLLPFRKALSNASFDLDAISRKGNDNDGALLDPDRFKVSVDQEVLWCGNNQGFNRWISELTLAVLNSFAKHRQSQYHQAPVLGRHLMKICKLQPTFCRRIFPHLIHDILLVKQTEVRVVLSRQVRNFSKDTMTA